MPAPLPNPREEFIVMSTLTSAWRHPINVSAHQKGGIHDDDTAQKLGFAGGTIAGSLHMEQFPPQLIAHFGNDWWQRGNLSLYFKSATIEGDAVQSELHTTDSEQVRASMTTEDERLVLEGTASLGEDGDSALRQRLAAVRPASDLRMLADVKVGETCKPLFTRATDADIDERLRVITEPLAAYQNTPQTYSTPAAACCHMHRLCICSVRSSPALHPSRATSSACSAPSRFNT